MTISLYQFWQRLFKVEIFVEPMISTAIIGVTTFLLIGQHVGHKSEPLITIKLSFEYSPPEKINSYRILLDGKLLQQFTLQDNGDPLAEFEETRIDFKKGKHTITIEMEGKEPIKIERDFTENLSFEIQNNILKE